MKTSAAKVCLLGDFAVGKTSTVARAVRNTFSESYLTTVGVKVDSKVVTVADDRIVRMVLWDIAGASELDQLRANYVVGAQGLLLVADGTRESTVRAAMRLREQVNELLAWAIPSVLVLNKCDLVAEWGVSAALMRDLRGEIPVITASAKTGQGVEESMRFLAGAMSS